MKIPNQQVPQSPDALNGKNIVIWGVGQYGGGIGSARFCHQHGAKVHLLDSKAASDFPQDIQDLAAQHKWSWHQGDQSHSILQSADLIICSPAIPPRALGNDSEILKKICSDIILFAHWHRGTSIAITGTKGKTSTANICSAICQWPVIGNSHDSVLAFLLEHPLDSNVIIELSSFQIYYAYHFNAISWDIGIITMIDRDHLDWHQDLEEYTACKHWLSQHSQSCIDQNTLRVTTNDGFFIHDETKMFAINKFPLTGHHQLRNACLAIDAALHAKVPLDQIQQGLKNIKGIAHRQELVHQCNNLFFINDSAATTPVACIAAVKTAVASGKQSVFILGGSDKGADYSELALLIQEQQIPCVLLGSAAAVLSEAGIHGPICESLEAAMECAVNGLAEEQNGQVVLSPACASFGLFSNYIDRGEQFTAFARMRWPSPSRPESA